MPLPLPLPMPIVCRAAAALCGLTMAAAAWGQTPQTPPSAPAPPAAAASAAQRVEITGGRVSDTEQRRQSTASKIVIGREEIDKFGDATVGEVLRRLPGVTTPGAPGRGGPPRMRGLGGGFTQLLIDGQRIPPGFSLESLTPEQIERIEILRAPTAETGARAIAGTINIVTREGFRRRLNDVRIGTGYENGRFTPGLNWTHNDSAGDLTYNVSGSLFRPRRESENTSRTTLTDAATGTLLEDRTGASVSNERRAGLNLNGRLQWRLGEGNGDSLSLMPMLVHSEGSSRARFTLAQPVRQPDTPRFYDDGSSQTDSRFTNARLGVQWRQRLGPVRMELGGNGGSFRAVSATTRREFGDAAEGRLRLSQDDQTTREDALQLNLKGTLLAFDGKHTIVAGAEADGSRRREQRNSSVNGSNLLAAFDDDLGARVLRLAAFAQDEWAVSPQWGAHAGLRWEGIQTRGDSGTGAQPVNRSSVWTPLLHAVYKPDPKGRDQVRVSLTRSYRSPGLGALIARPQINRDLLPPEESRFTSPDSGGNPDLKPEVALGVDIAVERYLEAGGVLSANLFHRKISDLIRSQTALETVPYTTAQRYVRRPQNIGDASTSGIELEAKFRLDQWLGADVLPLEVRSNLSLYRSKVDGIPGPDNRLDQQAWGTANIGADYRLRSLPLTLGGNVNWVPGYRTQVDDNQAVSVTRKTVWDAYALWAFNPQVGLRLLGSNLDARDYATTTVTDDVAAGERTVQRSAGPSYVNWQLRLELKL